MWLIVGLGNPGTQYQLTRHNIGFMAVDFFLGDRKSLEKKEFKSLFSKVSVDGNANNKISDKTFDKSKDLEVGLLKPQTFMNLSGDAVVAALQFYKIPLDRLIVIHDEIDQPFGKIKIQKNRGHGGHNGVRDITAKLGSSDYIRLRLGVGRPAHPEMNVSDYVLQKFTSDEIKELPQFLEKSVHALESILLDGISVASTKFN